MGTFSKYHLIVNKSIFPANDFHIEFDTPVEILGVAGKSDSDPDARFSLGQSDDRTQFDITDLPKMGPGQNRGGISLRVRNEGQQQARIVKENTYFTRNGKRLDGRVEWRTEPPTANPIETSEELTTESALAKVIEDVHEMRDRLDGLKDLQ